MERHFSHINMFNYLPLSTHPFIDLDMIPDKIYLPIIEEDGKRLLCTIWCKDDVSRRNANIKETIPYIRKDAFWNG